MLTTVIKHTMQGADRVKQKNEALLIELNLYMLLLVVVQMLVVYVVVGYILLMQFVVQLEQCVNKQHLEFGIVLTTQVKTNRQTLSSHSKLTSSHFFVLLLVVIQLLSSKTQQLQLLQL